MSEQTRQEAVQALRDKVAAKCSGLMVLRGWANRQTAIGSELAYLLIVGQLQHRRTPR